MKRKQLKSWLLGIITALLLIPCISLADKPFERIVVFGDSLSDPGNAFYLSGRKLKPPYDTLDAFLIPDAPYARGGNHFSNGATWIEQLANKLDLRDSVKPAFKGENEGKLKRTNYAVGGARAYEDGININLTAQMNAFFADAQGVASEDALYVIALGGNDVRDAVAVLSIDPTGSASGEILGRALMTISDSIFALYHAGARKLLIANSPDLSLTPAIQSLDIVSPGASLAAALTSLQFNVELDTLLDTLSTAFPDLKIARLDIYQRVHDIVANPDEFGLKNVQDACVMPNQPPFACKKPKRYLFWDGIHPTKAAHRILAGNAAEVLMVNKDNHCERDEDHIRRSNRCR
ncbi:MAG: SGNH/GDSL hydrolase family protein [Candidatus Thiodiazotropha sp. (ex Lucinoma kastoroae)]|nr:SGNH/GDSL hydrolase family protein [Candidatus Thiodiazotropha sp. (ex Lucinoma kastoroae)]MCU7858620.1 SGNH/GDSL hydrolase family protein [Candidatus Thiodiazotropha sp. (ex Lucinoma kastoroae)]